MAIFKKVARRREPKFPAELVGVLDQAGVYVARYTELYVWSCYWAPESGWRLLQGYDLRALVNVEEVDEVERDYRKRLTGAASQGLLEVPTRFGETVGLLDLRMDDGWRQKLTRDGRVKRYGWDGEKWVVKDPKPKWTRNAVAPPEMPKEN